MPDTLAIASEKYVRLSTYTKDGTPKYVPVWIAALDDGKIGFNTEAASWKAKRRGPTMDPAHRGSVGG